MSAKTALKVILIIVIAGLLFSGYLSYMELWHPNGCNEAIVKCSVGDKPAVDLGTIPACVYGFVMYLIILIITILGLCCKKKADQPSQSPPPTANNPQ